MQCIERNEVSTLRAPEIGDKTILLYRILKIIARDFYRFIYTSRGVEMFTKTWNSTSKFVFCA